MNWLIVTSEQQTALDSINEAHPFQKCISVATVDGTLVTPADKIGVEYWSAWQDWLTSLTPFNGNPIWDTTLADSVDTPSQT